MKRIVIAFGVVLLAAAARASGVMTIEAPVNAVGTPATVAISSTTLTMVPTSQTSGRQGIFLGIPPANSGKIVGFFGNCTSTSLASTIQPLQFAPGSNSIYIPLREDVCLWFITTNTSASTENVSYQEVKQ